MLKTERLPDGRIRTYSDKYFIRQISTGNVYSEAVDFSPKQYEETNLLLPEEIMEDEITPEEIEAVLEGIL